MCLAVAGVHFAITTWKLNHLYIYTWDLYFFDDVLYAISHGDLSGSSTILGHPVLADHVSYILYPLSLFYLISPDLQWLFAFEALALAAGGWAVEVVGRQAGLSVPRAQLLVMVYLLHPIVFNQIYPSFHPEVLAVPALLVAVWAAREGSPRWFGVALLVTLGCKWTLSITVAALGAWLLCFDKRRPYGLAALLAGIVWGVVSVAWILPMSGLSVDRHIYRFTEFGLSWSEIVGNLSRHPGRIWLMVATRDHLRDLAGIFLPLAGIYAWSLRCGSPRRFSGLLVLLPALALALLDGSSWTAGAITRLQYSLPLLPILMFTAADCLPPGLLGAAGRNPVGNWDRRAGLALLWAIFTFLGLSDCIWWFREGHAPDPRKWRPTREAIGRLPADSRVLTQRALFPLIARREFCGELIVPVTHIERTVIATSSEYEFALLNTFCEPTGAAQAYVVHLGRSPQFRLIYQEGPVFLFRRGQSQAAAAQE